MIIDLLDEEGEEFARIEIDDEDYALLAQDAEEKNIPIEDYLIEMLLDYAKEHSDE